MFLKERSLQSKKPHLEPFEKKIHNFKQGKNFDNSEKYDIETLSEKSINYLDTPYNGLNDEKAKSYELQFLFQKPSSYTTRKTSTPINDREPLNDLPPLMLSEPSIISEVTYSTNVKNTLDDSFDSEHIGKNLDSTPAVTFKPLPASPCYFKNILNLKDLDKLNAVTKDVKFVPVDSKNSNIKNKKMIDLSVTLNRNPIIEQYLTSAIKSQKTNVQRKAKQKYITKDKSLQKVRNHRPFATAGFHETSSKARKAVGSVILSMPSSTTIDSSNGFDLPQMIKPKIEEFTENMEIKMEPMTCEALEKVLSYEENQSVMRIDAMGRVVIKKEITSSACSSKYEADFEGFDDDGGKPKKLSNIINVSDLFKDDDDLCDEFDYSLPNSNIQKLSVAVEHNVTITSLGNCHLLKDTNKPLLNCAVDNSKARNSNEFTNENFPQYIDSFQNYNSMEGFGIRNQNFTDNSTVGGCYKSNQGKTSPFFKKINICEDNTKWREPLPRREDNLYNVRSSSTGAAEQQSLQKTLSSVTNKNLQKLYNYNNENNIVFIDLGSPSNRKKYSKSKTCQSSKKSDLQPNFEQVLEQSYEAACKEVTLNIGDDFRSFNAHNSHDDCDNDIMIIENCPVSQKLSECNVGVSFKKVLSPSHSVNLTDDNLTDVSIKHLIADPEDVPLLSLNGVSLRRIYDRSPIEGTYERGVTFKKLLNPSIPTQELNIFSTISRHSLMSPDRLSNCSSISLLSKSSRISKDFIGISPNKNMKCSSISSTNPPALVHLDDTSEHLVSALNTNELKSSETVPIVASVNGLLPSAKYCKSLDWNIENLNCNSSVKDHIIERSSVVCPSQENSCKTDKNYATIINNENNMAFPLNSEESLSKSPKGKLDSSNYCNKKATIDYETFNIQMKNSCKSYLKPSDSSKCTQPMTRKVQQEKYICPLCIIVVNKKKDYFKHFEDFHLNMGNYVCTVCSYCVSSKCNFNQHLEVHLLRIFQNLNMYRENGTINCNFCKFSTILEIDLFIHKATHIPKQFYYRCENCKVSYKMEEILEIHECVLKNENFPTDPKLVSNYGKHHYESGRSNVLLIECPYCPFVSIYQNCLTKHKLVHSDPSKFANSNCLKDIESVDNLIFHKGKQLSNANMRNYKCYICETVFISSSKLKLHILFHTKDFMKYRKKTLVRKKTVIDHEAGSHPSELKEGGNIIDSQCGTDSSYLKEPCQKNVNVEISNQDVDLDKVNKNINAFTALHDVINKETILNYVDCDKVNEITKECIENLIKPAIFKNTHQNLTSPKDQTSSCSEYNGILDRVMDHEALNISTELGGHSDYLINKEKVGFNSSATTTITGSSINSTTATIADDVNYLSINKTSRSTKDNDLSVGDRAKDVQDYQYEVSSSEFVLLTNKSDIMSGKHKNFEENVSEENKVNTADVQNKVCDSRNSLDYISVSQLNATTGLKNADGQRSSKHIQQKLISEIDVSNRVNFLADQIFTKIQEDKKVLKCVNDFSNHLPMDRLKLESDNLCKRVHTDAKENLKCYSSSSYLKKNVKINKCRSNLRVTSKKRTENILKYCEKLEQLSVKYTLTEDCKKSQTTEITSRPKKMCYDKVQPVEKYGKKLISIKKNKNCDLITAEEKNSSEVKEKDMHNHNLYQPPFCEVTKQTNVICPAVELFESVQTMHLALGSEIKSNGSKLDNQINGNLTPDWVNNNARLENNTFPSLFEELHNYSVKKSSSSICCENKTLENRSESVSRNSSPSKTNSDISEEEQKNVEGLEFNSGVKKNKILLNYSSPICNEYNVEAKFKANEASCVERGIFIFMKKHQIYSQNKSDSCSNDIDNFHKEVLESDNNHTSFLNETDKINFSTCSEWLHNLNSKDSLDCLNCNVKNAAKIIGEFTNKEEVSNETSDIVEICLKENDKPFSKNPFTSCVDTIEQTYISPNKNYIVTVDKKPSSKKHTKKRSMNRGLPSTHLKSVCQNLLPVSDSIASRTISENFIKLSSLESREENINNPILKVHSIDSSLFICENICDRLAINNINEGQINCKSLSLPTSSSSLSNLADVIDETSQGKEKSTGSLLLDPEYKTSSLLTNADLVMSGLLSNQKNLVSDRYGVLKINPVVNVNESNLLHASINSVIDYSSISIKSKRKYPKSSSEEDNGQFCDIESENVIDTPNVSVLKEGHCLSGKSYDAEDFISDHESNDINDPYIPLQICSSLIRNPSSSTSKIRSKENSDLSISNSSLMCLALSKQKTANLSLISSPICEHNSSEHKMISKNKTSHSNCFTEITVNHSSSSISSPMIYADESDALIMLPNTNMGTDRVKNLSKKTHKEYLNRINNDCIKISKDNKFDQPFTKRIDNKKTNKSENQKETSSIRTKVHNLLLNHVDKDVCIAMKVKGISTSPAKCKNKRLKTSEEFENLDFSENFVRKKRAKMNAFHVENSSKQEIFHSPSNRSCHPKVLYSDKNKQDNYKIGSHGSKSQWMHKESKLKNKDTHFTKRGDKHKKNNKVYLHNNYPETSRENTKNHKKRFIEDKTTTTHKRNNEVTSGYYAQQREYILSLCNKKPLKKMGRIPKKKALIKTEELKNIPESLPVLKKDKSVYLPTPPKLHHSSDFFFSSDTENTSDTKKESIYNYKTIKQIKPEIPIEKDKKEIIPHISEFVMPALENCSMVRDNNYFGVVNVTNYASDYDNEKVCLSSKEYDQKLLPCAESFKRFTPEKEEQFSSLTKDISDIVNKLFLDQSFVTKNGPEQLKSPATNEKIVHQSEAAISGNNLAALNMESLSNLQSSNESNICDQKELKQDEFVALQSLNCKSASCILQNTDRSHDVIISAHAIENETNVSASDNRDINLNVSYMQEQLVGLIKAGELIDCEEQSISAYMQVEDKKPIYIYDNKDIIINDAQVKDCL